MRSIEYAYSRGCRDFYTGGALGFDTVAARQVILFKISHPDVRLILLIPYKDQEAAWKESDIDAYNYILSQADVSEILSDTYTDDCMKVRNYKMIDNSTYVIAYYDGTVRSGTGQTFRYAQKCGLGIINICKEEY